MEQACRAYLGDHFRKWTGKLGGEIDLHGRNHLLGGLGSSFASKASISLGTSMGMQALTLERPVLPVATCSTRSL